MKGRTANPLIQQLLTHGSKHIPIDKTVNRLCWALFGKSMTNHPMLGGIPPLIIGEQT